MGDLTRFELLLSDESSCTRAHMQRELGKHSRPKHCLDPKSHRCFQNVERVLDLLHDSGRSIHRSCLDRWYYAGEHNTVCFSAASGSVVERQAQLQCDRLGSLIFCVGLHRRSICSEITSECTSRCFSFIVVLIPILVHSTVRLLWLGSRDRHTSDS